MLEIEVHLDGCADCRRLLYALADAGDDTRDHRIGRYVITRQLGEGGMGVVFAARDPELNRDVAIKLLRSASNQSDAAARLRREAQGLARLDHPNVVSIFDVGTHGNEVYLAMELVRGGSLAHWLKTQPRSWRAIMQVILQAGRGLAAAHAAGLVHRDIKPENVMVTGNGHAKIVDFGLVHGFGGEASTELGDATDADALAVRVTRTGGVVGTPAYSAPEVLAGERADRRSDVYSFCVMVFEAIYGKLPFRADTVAELRLEHRADVVALPHSPRVPRALRRMLLRGLCCEPGARYATIGALVPTLHAVLWPQRTIAAFAIAAFAVVVAGAVALHPGDTSDRVACEAAARPAELAFDEIAIRAAFAATNPHGRAIADRVIDRLDGWRRAAGSLTGSACRASRIDGTESAELFDMRVECIARSAKRVAALARQLTTPTAALVDNADDAIERAGDVAACGAGRELLAPYANVDPVRRAAAAAFRDRLATAEAVDATGRFADAARDAEQIAAQGASAGLRDVEAEAWSLVGHVYEGSQQPLPARSAYQRAVIAAEAVGDSRLRIQLYLRLAAVDEELDRHPDAVQWAAQARALFDRIGEPALRWRVLWIEAGVAANPPRSIALLREAIAAHDALVSVEDGDSVSLQRSLGAAQSAAGERDLAIATLEHSVAMAERILGPAQPGLIDPLTQLGGTYAALTRADKAAPLLERALAIATRTAGRQQLPKTALVLAAVYGEQGRTAESLAMLDRTIETFRRAYGEADALARLLALRSEMTALAALESDDTPDGKKPALERALADWLAALAIYRRNLRVDAPELATWLERVGRVQRFADKPSDAIRSFEEALAIRARDPAPIGDAGFEAELGLGGALAEAGRAAEGVPHIETALANAESRKTASDVAMAKAELGGALITLGRDRARAIKVLREARAVMEPIDAAEIDRQLARLGVK